MPLLLATALATAAGYAFAQFIGDLSTSYQNKRQKQFAADAAKVQALYDNIINNYSSQVANIDKYLSQYDLKLSDFKDLANHSSRISTINKRLNRVLGDYQKIRANAQGARDDIQRLANRLTTEASKRVTEISAGNYGSINIAKIQQDKDPISDATNAIASTIVDHKERFGSTSDSDVLNEINTSLSTLNSSDADNDKTTNNQGGAL
jgi:hypothetical protein